MLFSFSRCSSLMLHFKVEFHSSKVIFNCSRKKAEKNWFSRRWVEFEHFIRFIQNWEKRQLNVPSIGKYTFQCICITCTGVCSIPFIHIQLYQLSCTLGNICNVESCNQLTVSLNLSEQSRAKQCNTMPSRAWQSSATSYDESEVKCIRFVDVYLRGSLIFGLVIWLCFATCCFGIRFAMQTQRLDAPNGFILFLTHWEA